MIAAEDMLFFIIRGCFLGYLLKDLVPVKDKFAKGRRWVFFGIVLQYTVYDMALSYLQAFRRLFYGGMDAAMDSRVSTVPLFVGMLLTALFCLCFFGEKKSVPVLLYLVLAFYTLKELIMFLLHSLFSLILKIVIAIETYLAINGNEWVLQNFQEITLVVQSLWNLLFHAVFLMLLFFSVRCLKKNLHYEGRRMTYVQQLFLAIPCVTGLCFGVLMRSILYRSKDVQVEFLMDDFPETHFLIPAISGLCLLSVLLSAVILKRLLESNEKEILVNIYENQISDMEEHMKDVERLYDGIRGMRHDMKNCVADLELLLHHNQSLSSDTCQKEMRGYLDGLCSAIEELEMKCSTGNPVTDVVISRKLRCAKENGISFDCDFLFPEGMGIGAFDISIILNNGLDNAIEAAKKEQKDKEPEPKPESGPAPALAPYICLDSYVRGNMFFIELRNSFTGSLHLDETGEQLLTVKKEAGHGLGLKNIRNCASKYLGKVDFAADGKEFALTVMLQGKR